jgi:mannose-6-phosphate isomerase-like protein (cupin superfamily)
VPAFTCSEVRSTAGPPRKTATLTSKPWCELDHVELVRLTEPHTFDRRRPSERLVVVDGDGVIEGADGGRFDAGRGQTCTLDGDGEFRVDPDEETTVVRLAGDWAPEPETGGFGIFDVERSDEDDGGDPVGYPKETAFDAHFHDCDEYFVILEGRGVVVSEGRFYEVAPDDVVATGKGHHHDVPQLVDAPLVGVYFETTLEGERRTGHLHEHTDGPAEPEPGRV